MKRSSTRLSGYTLIEMIITITISTVVLASVIGVVIHQQRFYNLAGDINETLGDLKRAENSMVQDLLPVSPGAGDVLYAGQDSFAIRVSRGVFSICDKKQSTDVSITVRSLTGNRLALLADSAFVYARGSSPGVSDDYWEPVRLTSVNPELCPDSTPGWRAIVPALNGIASQVPVGSPVRVYRHASYWLQETADGWYLKTDATHGSPMVVAGPLTPAGGVASSTLRIRYLDDDGDPASTTAEIAQVALDIAAVGTVPRTRGGEPYSTTRRLTFDLRNN
jgi:prepilin-type N-terminal cleavage/methylation domain-containing protein